MSGGGDGGPLAGLAQCSGIPIVVWSVRVRRRTRYRWSAGIPNSISPLKPIAVPAITKPGPYESV